MTHEIRFHNSEVPGVFAEALTRSISGVVRISDYNEYVLLENEESARALIKALETAIEQGWFSE